jgi:hypothetical protein
VRLRAQERSSVREYDRLEARSIGHVSIGHVR